MITFLVIFLVALIGLTILFGLRVRAIRTGRVTAPGIGEAPEYFEDALPLRQLEHAIRTKSFIFGRKILLALLKLSMRGTSKIHRVLDRGLAKIYHVFVQEHEKLVETQRSQSTFLKKIGEYKENLKHRSQEDQSNI